MREQTFTRTDLIGYTTDSGRVVDTTLHNMMEMLKLMPSGVKDSLTVGYKHESDGIHIYGIHNDKTGELYWSLGDDGNWSETDEKLLDNLLMWGELNWKIILKIDLLN